MLATNLFLQFHKVIISFFLKLKRILILIPDWNILKQVESAVARIRQQWRENPRCAVILGTGLGAFVDGLKIEAVCQYEELPGFHAARVIGHAGELVCGKIDSIPVIALRGRAHFYEGVSQEQITFPVRVLHQLGVQSLVVSCAAGGLSSAFRAGELMLLEDQIDFLFPRRNSRAAPSKRSSFDCFAPELKELLKEIAREQNVPLQTGTYISVTGPNYETRAEMRFYRQFADAIGMSTVPEVQLAKQLGLNVCGVATITNVCHPDAITRADGEHVVCVASQTEPIFRRLILELIRRIARPDARNPLPEITSRLL